MRRTVAALGMVLWSLVGVEAGQGQTLTPDLKALAEGKPGAIPAGITLTWVANARGRAALKVQSSHDNAVMPWPASSSPTA